MGDKTASSLVDLTVSEFTDMLSSKLPLPGGGSAAALAGALGAALAAMVARLTIGRARYVEHDAEMGAICDTADDLRARLLALVDADTRVYREVMAAYQMPQKTASQSTRRTNVIQAALSDAAQVSLEAAGLCMEAVELAAAAARHGNRNASGDAAVGAILAHAGLRSATRNTRTNLVLVCDAHDCNEMKRRADEIEATGEMALGQALAAADAVL